MSSFPRHQGKIQKKKNEGVYFTYLKCIKFRRNIWVNLECHLIISRLGRMSSLRNQNTVPGVAWVASAIANCRGYSPWQLLRRRSEVCTKQMNEKWKLLWFMTRKTGKVDLKKKKTRANFYSVHLLQNGVVPALVLFTTRWHCRPASFEMVDSFKSSSKSWEREGEHAGTNSL